MTVQTFRSFDEFADALGHDDLRITSLGRERSPWRTCRVDLGGVLVRAAHDGGPCLYEVAIAADGVGFAVCPGAAGKVTGNGALFGPHSLFVIPGREEVQSASLDAGPWYSVFVSAERLFPDRGETPARPHARLVEPGRVPGETFQRTLGSIALAAQAGAFESNPLGRHDASERLVAQARQLLQLRPPASTGQTPGRHRISRSGIVRRAQERIEEGGAGIGLHDLADAAGVSPRTLHNVFREQFGISPKRFLRVRLLNAARCELRRADPDSVRVTDVAARLGIWEWGRFARDYHALFGELPSETLRRC